MWLALIVKLREPRRSAECACRRRRTTRCSSRTSESPRELRMPNLREGGAMNMAKALLPEIRDVPYAWLWSTVEEYPSLGGHRVDRTEDRLHPADAARTGQAPASRHWRAQGREHCRKGVDQGARARNHGTASCRADPEARGGLLGNANRSGKALNRCACRATPTAAGLPPNPGCRWSAACRRRRSSWRPPGSTAPARPRSSRAARPTGARGRAAW